MANPKKKGFNDSLINIAARFGSINTFKFLLINNVQSTGNLMNDAVFGGNLEIVKTCENQGFKTENGFEIAMFGNHNEIADWFLNKSDCEVVIPEEILEFGNIRGLMFSIINKTKIDIAFNECTLLTRLVDLGATKLVDFALTHGADPKKTSYSRLIPLSFAAMNNDLETTKILVEKHNSPLEASKRSPIHDAAAYGRVDVLKYLIDKGVNVNVQAQRRWTPLHFACDGGQLECVKLLVSRGADTQALAYKGEFNFRKAMKNPQDPTFTPLKAAKGHPDVCNFLKKLEKDRKKKEKAAAKSK
ncbi:hypothetical protein TVAG_168420 [Trichomonas vaginalis G3]|uniref:Uncharacterized protein n=1 Tax=Trichomonas vaginalis (strain ATCC PRA-98 / G3) TaxID=412133 RepID=A2F2E5_TRIV3|nr:spectrin binding [Trichomonas vaginalis G3]EAY00911.1 hypothetical protein TVAG_168420 [Trichomonas vaginalis G3]KAI5554150.1 spectrin binding [Trichomonas vaginalis G3]|eukprot:XP_001313840.1 hypothetical protein [Trichomonas vaginalis G3]